MPRIAVGPDSYQRCLNRPDANIDSFEILDLNEALNRTWTSDSHAVMYLYGDKNQTRISKQYVNMLDKEPNIEVFFCDVDTPNHKNWTTDTLKNELDNLPNLEELGVGIYFTRAGFRLIQPLSKSIPFSIVEKHLRIWLFKLEAKGVNVDWACVEATRLFRMPNVKRDGKQFTTPFMDLSHMRPYEINYNEADIPPRGKSGNIIELISDWPDELPDRYRPIAEKISQSILKVQNHWHMLFLPIAGALHGFGIPKEHLPHLCRVIAELSGDSKAKDRYTVGQTTAVNLHNGKNVLGFSYLRNKFPTVAEAIQSAFNNISADVVVPTSGITVYQAYEEVKKIIRDTTDISIIRAPTGLGKTYASQEIAVERHRLNLKTAISVDKNNLAVQVRDDIAKSDVDTYRIFGSLSVLNEKGESECKFSDIAKNLAEGGQSVYYELCEGRTKQKCEYYDTCKARERFEGSDSSNIIIGTHAKIRDLNEFAGKKGLLIIDEPKSLIETYTITKSQMKDIQNNLQLFEHWYVKKIKDYIDLLCSWEDPTLQYSTLTQDIDLKYLFTSQIALLEGLEETTKKNPPYQIGKFQLSKDKKIASKIIGTTSKWLTLLTRAKNEKSIVYLEGGTIFITIFNQDMLASVGRSGPVVISDANADLIKPYIESILKRNLDDNYYSFSIKDNCDVERKMIRVSGANRSNWIYNGHPQFEVGTGPKKRNTGLSEVFSWVAQWHKQGKTIGVITFKSVAELIRKKDNRIPKEFLDMNPIVGHYYSLRGLNSMKELDEIVTIGDPFKNMDAIKNELSFSNRVESIDEEGIKIAKAELEQAHGRLRTIRREKAARMMHVGLVLPGGFGWNDAEIQVAPRRLGGSIMRSSEMELLLREKGISQTEFSEIANISVSTVSNYLAGRRTIPHDVALQLLEM